MIFAKSLHEVAAMKRGIWGHVFEKWWVSALMLLDAVGEAYFRACAENVTVVIISFVVFVK